MRRTQKVYFSISYAAHSITEAGDTFAQCLVGLQDEAAKEGMDVMFSTLESEIIRDVDEIHYMTGQTERREYSTLNMTAMAVNK